MRVRILLALAGVVSLAACRTTTTTSTTVSGTPVLTQVPVPVAPPIDPVGKWSVAIVAQGQAMELTVDVSKLTDGTYGGMITSQTFPPMAIAKATLIGNKLEMLVPTPDGQTATIVMNISGDLVDGEWSMPGDGSKLSGKRIK